MNRFGMLRRTESPRLFVAMIAVRWIGIGALVLVAFGGAFGWLPKTSH